MATTLSAIRLKVRERLLETLALTTPGSPLVTPQGTPGTTTISYAIVAKNNVGTSPASQVKTTTTAAATLTGVNFNRLTWLAVPGEESGYDIYRTATNGTSPTTVGLIGSVATGVVTFDDTGLAGDAATAPTDNTSGITSPFWTEQELFDLEVLGAKDLWRAMVDLKEGHFKTINEDDVSLASGDTELTGVPSDCFSVSMIEPLDLTDTGPVYLTFRPKPYKSLAFQNARSASPQASTYTTVFYDILNPGSPVSAPTVVVAPTLPVSVDLRFVYTHTLPTLTESSNNPIPGESDNALIAWTVAWARAKEREDRMPDPAYLTIYATEKQALLTSLSPRQEQEERVVEGLYDAYNQG